MATCTMAADVAGPKAIESREGYGISLPVASNEVIYSGALVTFDRSGLKAYEADDHGVSDYLCAGIAAETVDNSGTSYTSSKTVEVRRGIFAVGRSTNALTRAYIGKPAFIVDNQTVTPFGVRGSNTVAGLVVDVDSTGKVWIDTRAPPTLSGATSTKVIVSGDAKTNTIVIQGTEIKTWTVTQ
jgi:hypothetical protein